MIAADVRKPASVARAVADADAVVNLVGSFADMDAVQNVGAGNVAKAAATAGVSALVHISAIGADAQSEAEYGRSKAAGEAAVRAAFPSATILRPSIVFGREDQFINRFAGLIRMLPVVPVIGAATQISAGLCRRCGKGGGGGACGARAAKRWSWADRRFSRCSSSTAGSPSRQAAIRCLSKCRISPPKLLAKSTGWLPGAPITEDQLKMLGSDNVVTGNDGLAALASCRRRSMRSRMTGSISIASTDGSARRRPHDRLDGCDHPRHCRGVNRVFARFVDRPLDIGDRAVGL